MSHKDLVLLGGGHTHVLLIKALAMRPIPGVRVTLISEKAMTPYSGMLPGFVAGHYTLDQTNIDLNQLCRRANVRWINARASNILTTPKSVRLVGAANVDFDILSIDIGSTPDQRVTGAHQFAVGVKPIAGFQQRWRTLLESSQEIGAEPTDGEVEWGVIGAGAGGVELVLAMAHRMRKHPRLRFHLIYRGASILPGYPDKVVRTVERYLTDYRVTLHKNFIVAQVTLDGIIDESGQRLSLNEKIWCTGAVGAPWLADSDLDTSDKHFIMVNHFLQSTSHESVFAVGDVAEMVDDLRPKAGVFAVRQAPQLERNLRRLFADKAMRPVNLQKQFLSLLAMGRREAIASRNGLVLSGRWVWRWKNRIDQTFMRQFSELEMTSASDMASGVVDTDRGADVMPCAGCASKLGPELLQYNLKQIDQVTSKLNAKFNLDSNDDAAVWTPTPGMAAVQSVDGFRSFTTDEYRLGRICVNHALSDIYAMGATPTHVQAWINLAFNSPVLQQRDHLRLLIGTNDALRESGAALSGGHSSEGLESHVAIVANGELKLGNQWRKGGVKVGDVLLLSKRLGTGVILAADMQGRADADAVDAAYDSMLQSNQSAMLSLLNHQASAVTDITGFGLIGHLLEVLESTNANNANTEAATPIAAELNLVNIPTLPGALELAELGWRSSLYKQLEPYLSQCSFGEVDDLVHDRADGSALVELMLDPQTSGGLLAAVSAQQASALLEEGDDFVAIGRVIEKSTDDVLIQLAGVSGNG